MTAESAMGPGNMALGATGDPQCAHELYAVIARETAAVGLNVVLGPAADCNSNPHNSIIGMRSFGEKPELVAAMTAAAVRGLQANGSVATLKHFPATAIPGSIVTAACRRSAARAKSSCGSTCAHSRLASTPAPRLS